MNVAAAQFALYRAIGHGDALVHAQIDIGGRVGGDPQPAGAEEHARGDGDGVIVFVGDVAFGHLADKLAKNGLDSFCAGGVFVFTGAQPQKAVVEPGKQALDVVFTIVLVHQIAGQCHSRALIRAKAGNKRLVQGDHSFRNLNENYL